MIFKSFNIVSKDLDELASVYLFLPLPHYINLHSRCPGCWLQNSVCFLNSTILIMCQSRFINCNNCTTLVGGVDNGGGMCGSRWYGKSLYFHLNFDNFDKKLKLL